MKELKWRRRWIGTTTIQTGKGKLMKNSIDFAGKSEVSAINLRVVRYVCTHANFLTSSNED
jgi:hypothetical protein